MNANRTLGTVGRYTIQISNEVRPLSVYERGKGVVAEHTVRIYAAGAQCWQGVPSRVLADPSQAAEAIFKQVADRLAFAALVAEAVTA